MIAVEILPSVVFQHEVRYTDIKLKSSQPPHIFAISDQSYQTMRRTGVNQCCVVSGESGAGTITFFFKANFIVKQIRYVKYEVIYTLKKSIFGFVFVTANRQKQGKFYPVVYPVACTSVFIY